MAASEFRELRNVPAGEVHALVAHNLEADRLVAKAVLAKDLDASDKCHSRGFILVEEVTPQQYKVNLHGMGLFGVGILPEANGIC